MKLLPLVLLLAGCSPIISNESENFRAFVDEARLNTNSDNIVKVIALRWTPKVIEALADERARKEHWTRTQCLEYAHDLIQEHYGGSGDSTTFVVSLTNTQWPCRSPILVTATGMKALIPQSMMPCTEIRIAEIYKHIWMENERGVKLPPLFVSPPRHENLTSEEILWVKFQIGSGSYSWESSSRNLDLVIDIKPETIRLRIK